MKCSDPQELDSNDSSCRMCPRKGKPDFDNREGNRPSFGLWAKVSKALSFRSGVAVGKEARGETPEMRGGAIASWEEMYVEHSRKTEGDMKRTMTMCC